MKELIVDVKNENKKIITYLLEQFPQLPSSLFYKALQKKDLMVNGKRIHVNLLLHAGDCIRMYIADTVLEEKKKTVTNSTPSFCLVYEDDHILIVNKKVGIEVTGENSLTTLLQQQYEKDFFPCHRLDRNTSGLVLFAKTDEALTILLEKFKHREIKKHYLTQVYGIVEKEQDTLVNYLFKDQKKSQVYIYAHPQKGYQKIITHYQVLNRNIQENTTLLDIELETGRTHQIRAHLAYLGHPIIGDGKYGKNEINKKFKQKTQLLCAYQLAFDFQTDSEILNYLNQKCFSITPNFTF